MGLSRFVRLTVMQFLLACSVRCSSWQHALCQNMLQSQSLWPCVHFDLDRVGEEGDLLSGLAEASSLNVFLTDCPSQKNGARYEKAESCSP